MVRTFFDATFWNDLIVMVADKLVIGSIIGLILYFAQRRLEAFRAQQTLETEIAKVRVDNIAKGWQALNEWDLAVTEVICEFARFIRDQHPELGVDAGLDKLGQPKLKELAEWLAKEQEKPTFVLLKARCEVDLKDLLKESEKRSSAARAIMQENRFWFGQELYKHCIRFHEALHGICIAFGRQNFENLPAQLYELDNVRLDVLMVLQQIRSLPQKESAESLKTAG